MASFMAPFSSQTYAALRIVAGFLFLWHGASKLFGVPVAAPDAPGFILYVGGGIELLGGVLVMVGFQTRWAAFLCSGMMAAAYSVAHGTDDLRPIMNKG